MAASYLPQYRAYAGSVLGWTFSSLTGGDAWRSSSTLSFRIRDRSEDLRWKWNISSDQAGLTASLTQYWCEVETPWAVSWSAPPAGWAISLTSGPVGAPPRWVYRFTRTALPQAFVVGTPEANTAATGLALDWVSGTVPNPTANGWISNGVVIDSSFDHTFPMSYSSAFTVTYPAPWSTTVADTFSRTTSITLSGND